MDRKYIDMHLVVDRYLQGVLAESEKAEFEERLVWDHELIDEVDLAEHLREGLRESVAEEKYTTSHANRGLVVWLADVLSTPQYAAAASFLLAVTLTTGVLLNPFAPAEEYQANPSTTTEIVPLLVLRGETAQTIRIDHQSWTVLLVDVMGDYDVYRVRIRRDESDADAFWTQSGLRPTYPDALAVGMPGKLLAAGRYVLTLEGLRDTETGEKAYEHLQDIAFIAVLAD